MKKYILISLLTFKTFYSWSQAFPAGDYDLIPSCSDEFNSSSTVNWSKLLYRYYSFSTDPKNIFYLENNVQSGQNSSIEPSTKVCKITSNTYPSTQAWFDPWNNTNQYANYNSGTLWHNQYFKYGYYEVRAKIPANNVAICSAFWLWNNIDNNYNEIDIFENNSGVNFHNYWSFSLHHGTSDEIFEYNAEYSPIKVINPCDERHPLNETNYNFGTSFHTFGMEWQPNYINFYLDGSFFKQFTMLVKHDGSNTQIPVNNMNIKMNVVLFAKVGCDLRLDPPPNGEAFEIDYFHYYKRKPVLTNASYNASNNSITMTVNTDNSEDSYYWQTLTPNVSFNWISNNTAQIALSTAYPNGVSVNVSATGSNPAATSTSTFTFSQISGNLCNISAQSNVYVAPSITAPQSGCSSVMVYSGTNVTFIAPNSITLNPGFEVQIGGTFNGLTQ